MQSASVPPPKTSLSVLCLSHKNPVREDEGAKIVTMGSLRHLSREECRVTLISLDADGGGIDQLSPFCESVRLVPHRRPGKLAGLTRSLGSGLPYSVLLFSNRAFAEAVREAVSRQTFDAVHMETALMYQYAPLLRGLPIVIRHHNLEGDLLRQQARSASNPLARTILSWQATRLMDYEKTAIRGAALSVAITGPDRDMILNDYKLKVPVRVVPSGIEIPSALPEAPTEHCVVFSGRIDWRPNAEAAEWFAKRVFPKLRSAFPELTFYIVGGRPPRSIMQLAGNGIVVTGYVDSVREYIDKAEVYVVPLLSGSGMRLKILEAMSRGKAIVSTPKGAEGIACRHDEDILLATDPEEFASAVLGLLRDASRRRELGCRAFSSVASNYSWDSVAARLAECYREARSSP